jgi:F0F1-type ATP synthase membrane subunit c/vacuolar-type H+-ATPase subunit K
MFHIKSPQDLGAAVLLLALGVAGLWFGREYEVGTASRMGPGYMPMALSWGLIVFGVIVGFRSFRLRGPAIEPIVWRTNVLILGAIICFALLIRSAGLAVATSVVTVLSALASRESRWKETIVLGVFLAILCVLVFIYALRQSIPVFGSS